MIFTRYVLIQVIAYILEMSAFVLLIKLSLSGILFANVGAKLAAGIFAFAMHRKFTFKSDQSDSIKKQAARYFILLAINIPISSAVLSLIFAWKLKPELAKIISDLICLFLTYIMTKKLVFIRSTRNGGGASPDLTA